MSDLVTTSDIVYLLKEISKPERLRGMKRFGIDTSHALGVTIPELRKLAKEIKINQQLSLELWETGIHECRILASMIGDIKQVTAQQMDKWVADFDSWDVCDQVCGNLFVKAPFVIDKVLEYTASEHEFVKRAGFVLIAELQVHNKKISDDELIKFLPIIEREAWDERNFVKKAVNWALRQIGKRNRTLLQPAIATAERIRQQGTKSARWIASNALAEFGKRL
ncbi:MAG: DNA alkylation repair protein [Bacteroidetes bacterium]|nr:DNA alkylation repair protein [Bacteroidota bacterium]